MPSQGSDALRRSRPAAIKRFAPTISTTDIKLASALLACGVPPVPGEEVSMLDGDCRRVEFNFLPVSMCGKYKTEALMAAWEMEQSATCKEERFTTRNPEHPFSYCMAVWANYWGLWEYVTRATPKLYIRRGPSVAVVDPDSPQHIQDHLLGKIGA